jgi:hypothetical protein
MKNNLQYNNLKQGGVSIFVVIAACILAAVIVGSFIRLALRDQSQDAGSDHDEDRDATLFKIVVL